MTPNDARAILRDCDIPEGTDYFSLFYHQVDGLLEHAKRRKYREPRNANGSRARYFHAYLERLARRA